MTKKTATADEVGLLQAICAHPEEDTPRLAYADWLDENKQPERAEFIRVQCRLATMDEYDPQRPHLEWRQRLLLTDKNKKKWAELPVKPVKEKTFHRGFIDDVSLHASLFLEGADGFFAHLPLRTLRPLRVGPVWNQLLASPQLLRLRGLDLHHSALSQVRSKALAASDQLANLHELNLGANSKMGANGLSAILGSPHLTNLRPLDLNNTTGKDSLSVFVGSGFVGKDKHFPNLRRLDLSGNKISPDGVKQLVQATWLARIERLDLSGNPLGDEGVRLLAESGILAGAKTLDLSNVQVGIAGVRALAKCPHLTEMTELYLRGGRKEDVLKEVAQSTTITKLRVLALCGGEAGMEALIRSPFVASLRALHLTNLSAAALEKLLTSPALSVLTWLSVSGDDKADLASLLREATHLKNLHYLGASGKPLNDKDIEVVANCAHLGGLAVLSLGRGTVTEAGMEAMMASPHFTRLRQLKLPIKRPTLDAPIRARIAERFGEDVYSYYWKLP